MQPPQCVPHVAEAVAMNEMRRALIICIFDDMIELAFCRVARRRRAERGGDRALNYGQDRKMRFSVGSDGGSGSKLIGLFY